jgi:hemerythrin superfamily protein
MGVRTSLLAITPTNTEVANCAADGQDLNGMLNFAAEKVADALQVLNAIQDFIPAGSNKTSIATQITALE